MPVALDRNDRIFWVSVNTMEHLVWLAERNNRCAAIHIFRFNDPKRASIRIFIPPLPTVKATLIDARYGKKILYTSGAFG